MNKGPIVERILIVDDAATVRMYHRGILESCRLPRRGGDERDRGAGKGPRILLRSCTSWISTCPNWMAMDF